MRRLPSVEQINKKWLGGPKMFPELSETDSWELAAIY